MPKITVVGSISTDFVVEVNRRPDVGETVEGNRFSTTFGGEGANQAVAAARLGATTAMIGAVGGDEFAPLLIDNLTKNHISVTDVERVTHQPSGAALITLCQADNSIVYVPGANGSVRAEDIRKKAEAIRDSDMVLVQHETPEEAVEELIELCQELQTPLLVNPAPARKIRKELIDKVRFLTPNETEFAALFPDRDLDEVLSEYPNKLIVTLGENGARFHDGQRLVDVPAYRTDRVVDTTGAGDTFNGAFAVACASSLSIEESIRFANLAASLSVQKEGAQTGAPALEEMKGHEQYEEKWTVK